MAPRALRVRIARGVVHEVVVGLYHQVVRSSAPREICAGKGGGGGGGGGGMTSGFATGISNAILDVEMADWRLGWGLERVMSGGC